MQQRIHAGHDFLSILQILKEELINENITNLAQWFNDWNLAKSYATILSGLGIVEKSNGCWEWVAEDPDEEMVDFVKQTNREYCAV